MDTNIIISYEPHLIDGESDGVHVLSYFPHPSSVLLDESHHEATAHLIITRVVILFLQLDLELGIHPERVCREPRLTKVKVRE